MVQFLFLIFLSLPSFAGQNSCMTPMAGVRAGIAALSPFTNVAIYGEE